MLNLKPLAIAAMSSRDWSCRHMDPQIDLHPRAGNRQPGNLNRRQRQRRVAIASSQTSIAAGRSARSVWNCWMRTALRSDVPAERQIASACPMMERSSALTGMP